MKTITTTEDLARFCDAAKAAPYVTLDTDFLRERTYYSRLCLIQMALPGEDGEAVLVDPLANTLSPDVSIELVRCESQEGVHRLWVQQCGEPAVDCGEARWRGHPATVSAVRAPSRRRLPDRDRAGPP